MEPSPDDGRRFLVADLGVARLGFDLARITEVLPLTRTARVPWAPAWVHGVLNHQGRLLTVVDLARFLEVGDPRPARVAAVVDQPSLSLALAVGTVAIVEARHAVRVTELKYYLPQSDWVVEALSTPDLNFHHLDVDRVVRGIVEAF